MGRETPRRVRVAAGLMVAAWVLGVGEAVLTWESEIGGLPVSWQAGLVGADIIIFAGLLWLTYEVYRRASWARITYLIIAVLTGLGYAILLRLMPQPPMGSLVNGIAQSAMEAVAIYLLFTGSARRWFKPQAADARRSRAHP